MVARSCFTAAAADFLMAAADMDSPRFWGMSAIKNNVARQSKQWRKP